MGGNDYSLPVTTRPWGNVGSEVLLKSSHTHQRGRTPSLPPSLPPHLLRISGCLLLPSLSALCARWSRSLSFPGSMLVFSKYRPNVLSRQAIKTQVRSRKQFACDSPWNFKTFFTPLVFWHSMCDLCYILEAVRAGGRSQQHLFLK